MLTEKEKQYRQEQINIILSDSINKDCPQCKVLLDKIKELENEIEELEDRINEKT